MDTPHTGMTSAHLLERPPGARSPRRSRLIRVARVPRALRRVAVLTLLFALACAAPAAASDVYVANRFSDNVSQYDVGAGGALTAKTTPTVPAGDAPFGVAVRPTPTIADPIDSVEELQLPIGVEDSLLAKLTGAQRDLAAGNTDGACAKLAAFIHQVSAQSGKKIDADDAEELIAEAQAVRESLGCGGG